MAREEGTEPSIVGKVGDRGKSRSCWGRGGGSTGCEDVPRQKGFTARGYHGIAQFFVGLRMASCSRLRPR